jgi:hypothetical protein
LNEVAALYVGGQFWDGGEMSLAGQAAGPFRHPAEMAMHDKKAVVQAWKTADCQGLFTAAYAMEEGDFDLSAVDAAWQIQGHDSEKHRNHRAIWAQRRFSDPGADRSFLPHPRRPAHLYR